MSSKKDPQENQTQTNLGKDSTSSDRNASSRETLESQGDLVDVTESLLDESTSDQTVDYSPGKSADSAEDPIRPTLDAIPNPRRDATEMFNPLIDPVDNDAPNAATCDFTQQSASSPDGTAILPKGWTSKKSSEDDFTLAPSPVIDSRLHSHSDTVAGQARIPKQIGAYTIEKVLGRGGMGIVYKAFQTKLGRPVALKMILGGAHVSEQVMSRFIAEAKAVAHLQHPNIVQIFEVGEHEGLPFFSLEYVNGPPLDKKLNGKPIAPDDAARWLIDICTAMQYAHDNGVLHRDLKPANVLSTKDGILKVSDFGLAKRLEDNADSSSTREGTIMGTPNYMSPEQARGAIHELGPATDQYSLGAMLYEFLTGRPPFMAPKPLETIMQVINSEPIPPRQLQPKLPIDIETICMKALQKDPTKRYASCQELASDLKRFLNREPILARPVGRIEQAWRWYLRNRLVGNLALATAMGLVSVAGISSYAAYSLSAKNQALKESEQATKEQAGLAKKAESVALANEELAKKNETVALANEKLAKDRAQSIILTTQEIYKQVKQLDANESPRIKERRDRMMRTLLPMLQEHILSQDPTDEAGGLTANALLMDYGLSMVQYGLKKEAKETLSQVEKFFSNRMEQKKSDAAKSNYLQIVRAVANMERELNRDLDASLDWFQKQSDIAQQMVDTPSADANGQGVLPWYQSTIFYARATHDLAVTYLRMGQISKVQSLAQKTQELCRDSSKRLAEELSKSELKDEERKLMKAAETAFREVTNASELLLTTNQFRSGLVEQSEPKIRSALDQLKNAYEKDINNSNLLRQYCGQLGLYSELICQNGRTREGIEGLEQADILGEKLLSFAPDNSDFIRTASLAGFRLTQWRRELKLADADAPGNRALLSRRKKAQIDPDNDVARMDWMMSEAQISQADKARELAEEFLKQPKIDNELLVLITRTYCMIAARETDATASETNLEKAVETMHKAIAQGFEDAGMLNTEIDFRVLSQRGRMQELLDLIDQRTKQSQ